MLLLLWTGRLQRIDEEWSCATRSRPWCYPDLNHRTPWISTSLSSEVESEISCGQAQNQTEGKVSADGERGKVSNIYYRLVLFLLELTKTYRTWIFKLHRIPTTDAEGCINNILLNSTSLFDLLQFFTKCCLKRVFKAGVWASGKEKGSLASLCLYRD